ncbi:MAG: adenylyl-sulfate kinase [Clostridia bacterium]|nr:adenylyl-sulfate kinase [Clostridia bacterium]
MNSLLKFITCGSVDDGKSTLIGHMLYDAKLIFADQENALEMDSKVGSTSGQIDYSLLLDGLMAEREQGITIDVAYRYFNTKERSFIVADCPGHEQYTRNMAVGASFADLAVILVDASKGILIQTKRHTRICSLMGIRKFVVAVNKMDLVNYSQEEFETISDDFNEFAQGLNLEEVIIIPVSATEGDNLTNKSANTPWYKGDTLLSTLENADVDLNIADSKFIMPVQRVCRPNHTFRGFQGQIETGSISVNDIIKVLPANEEAKVSQLFVADKETNTAFAGQPVTVCLDREIDISRGCVLVKDADLKISSMFTASILWMDNKSLVEGRHYLLKLGTKIIPATIMEIKHKVDINTGKHISAEGLEKNEIGLVDIFLSEDIVFSKFCDVQAMGEFILIDRISNMTSACGVIEHGLRRATNVVYQKTDITREIRQNQKDQKSMVLWFTGLSGSGKSTLANEIEKRLFALGKHTMLLDGDNVRHGLNNNLGFKEADRIENIRRIAEVAKLMNDAGLIVLASFISPYESDRRNAREIIGDKFVEIYVSTPLEECERRDVKGLYKKARNNEIPNFTGISSPYEAPQNPDLQINTAGIDIAEAADILMREIKKLL